MSRPVERKGRRAHNLGAAREGLEAADRRSCTLWRISSPSRGRTTKSSFPRRKCESAAPVAKCAKAGKTNRSEIAERRSSAGNQAQKSAAAASSKTSRQRISGGSAATSRGTIERSSHTQIKWSWPRQPRSASRVARSGPAIRTFATRGLLAGLLSANLARSLASCEICCKKGPYSLAHFSNPLLHSGRSGEKPLIRYLEAFRRCDKSIAKGAYCLWLWLG
jgi:hypothetical protein